MIDVKSISTHCTRTEFVGTTVLDTIGLVISGIDDTLLKEMNVGMKYHALGLFSSRTGAAGQITAIDDAVKATNTEVLSIEFPRDTKGWGGHGNYIVIGGSASNSQRKMQGSFISVSLVIWNSLIPQAQEPHCRKHFMPYQARHSASWQDLLLQLVL